MKRKKLAAFVCAAAMAFGAGGLQASAYTRSECASLLVEVMKAYAHAGITGLSDRIPELCTGMYSAITKMDSIVRFEPTSETQGDFDTAYTALREAYNSFLNSPEVFGGTLDGEAAAVRAVIAALPFEISSTDEPTVKAARAAFDALTAEQQESIGYLLRNRLEACEEALGAAARTAAETAVRSSDSSVSSGIRVINTSSAVSDAGAVRTIPESTADDTSSESSADNGITVVTGRTSAENTAVVSSTAANGVNGNPTSGAAVAGTGLLAVISAALFTVRRKH